MKIKTPRTIWIAGLLIGCIVATQFAAAQCDGKVGFAKAMCQAQRVGAGGVPSLDGMKGPALTTNFTDTIHADTMPPTVDPKAFTPLSTLQRTDDGAFILKAGFFEAYVQSFSMEPGDTNGRAGGFFPAPIKGRRAKAITDVLKYSELHPDMPQADIQQLLWAIVGGADLETMPPQVQQTAGSILPRETLSQMQGSTAAKIANKILMDQLGKWLGKNPKLGQGLGKVEQETRNADQKYGISDTLNGLAGAGSSAPSLASSDGLIVRGTWAQMPGGFFVRYLPDGAAKTRVQVIVPETAVAQAATDKPLTFDPTQYLAVYGQAPAQRLGISLRPVQTK